MMAEQVEIKKEKKEVGIAVLISIVGLLVLGAPSLGYFYLGFVRKGIIYLVGTWLLTIAAVAIYFIIGAITVVGFICLIPLLFIPFIVSLLTVWDVYVIAKDEKSKLPNL